jgi:hypothetical protein
MRRGHSKKAPNGVAFEEAQAAVGEAANLLFQSDPTIQSVGVVRHRGAYGLRAIKNPSRVVPMSSTVPKALYEIRGVPVTYLHSRSEAQPLIKVPAAGPGSPGESSIVAEQRRHRPLFCGVQIQNYDIDEREGFTKDDIIMVGTLGCFVRSADGAVALLSNSHVVAGMNRGMKGTDRITQSGSSKFNPDDHVATLTDYIEIKPTPFESAMVFNEVDAGIAVLKDRVDYLQSFRPERGRKSPRGTSLPRPGDRVFKVGRTTGLTTGSIESVGEEVRGVQYERVGPCGFRGTFTIRGSSGTLFSDHGDSGSVILRPNGEVVGVLFAGNDVVTYACPIDSVLRALACTLL